MKCTCGGCLIKGCTKGNVRYRTCQECGKTWRGVTAQEWDQANLTLTFSERLEPAKRKGAGAARILRRNSALKQIALPFA